MSLWEIMSHSLSQVRKRDGRIVAFDSSRIQSALFRAMRVAGEGDLAKDPARVAEQVVSELNRRYSYTHITSPVSSPVPSIEEIQDLVEESLILFDFPKTAKAYILYRQERARIREKAKAVPERVKKLAAEGKRYFQGELSEFIYYRTYSRWIEEEGRRETWTETIDRYVNYMREVLGERLSESEYADVRQAILSQRVMPSMRLLWSAGPAARASHACAYNCAYIAPSGLDDFPELMYLLMCGTGVGFSVESQCVQQLPIIQRQRPRRSDEKVAVHRIEDSKEGWCDALRLGLHSWYGGEDIEFDYSRLRPAGARLRTMGGRSSGPEPLRALMTFLRSKILSHQGRRLGSVDVHDMVCKIGEVIVMGGVRRSALISLSDFEDEGMREAKSGPFFLQHPERAMADNSAVYDSKPTSTAFLEEWLALAKGGTGERGIFNRGSLRSQLPERRWALFQEDWANSGTNPCGEIILRSKQFCNLTEVVARPKDDEGSLLEKIRIATLIGTYQSTLTKFPYLSQDWKRKCEEERLLGVSITGQWDNSVARDPEVLRKLKARAIEVNRHYAERFGIRPSSAITCVKPSGTVSLLVNSASGMHPRHARFYLRRIRISATDPLFEMLKEQKFPYHPEVGQMEGQAATYVLEFPVKAPEGAVLRDDLRALDQMEHWKQVKRNFTEHNPSMTISVGDEEWIEVANWLYRNWEWIGGLSFLPRTENVYPLAPYEEISKERYEKLVSELPKVDFSRIIAYEKEDRTVGARSIACSSSTCEFDP